MPIRTTCIGAYPKPDYLPISDWFQVACDDAGYTDKVIEKWSEEKIKDTYVKINESYLSCEFKSDWSKKNL